MNMGLHAPKVALKFLIAVMLYLYLFRRKPTQVIYGHVVARPPTSAAA
jgi:hypothetical protein